jgi:DinB family protein
MTRPISFEAAAADHREAIASVVDVVRSVDPGIWTVSRGPGKWSPAEIAEHLALAYEPPLAELEGGAGYTLRLKGWKQALVRWKYLPAMLERGRFPAGVRAPREARPTSHAATPEAAGERLLENANRFERRLAQAEAVHPVRLTHAYFGLLQGPEILRLLAVHARHHGKQFPSAAARPGGDL